MPKKEQAAPPPTGAPREVIWQRTPAIVREQGFINQEDLYESLGITRQGLYFRLKGKAVRKARFGRKLYIHYGDAMAALFPTAPAGEQAEK